MLNSPGYQSAHLALKVSRVFNNHFLRIISIDNQEKRIGELSPKWENASIFYKITSLDQCGEFERPQILGLKSHSQWSWQRDVPLL